MGKLSGKVALITGASKGIGEGIACVYAREGADLILCARSESTKTLCEELMHAYGIRAQFVRCDVSRMEDCREAVRLGVEQFGRIDVLVSNAGVCRLGSFLDASEEDRDHHIDVNIKGTWNIAQGGAAGHGGSTQRPHRHHELGDRLYGRRSGRGGICPQQGGADRADQGTGQGVCQRRHLCQRHLPGLCRYTDGPEHRSAVQCRRSGFRHTGIAAATPLGRLPHRRKSGSLQRF